MDTKYYQGNQIKDYGWVRNVATCGRKETHSILNEKSEEKRHLDYLKYMGW